MPRVYVLCQDPTIIRTAFYVIEYVQGRIITDVDLGELSPPDRRKVRFCLIETLAWMHSIDPDTIGLGQFGKKTNFCARQCNTFSRIESQQSPIQNIKSGEPLGGAHPQYDEIVAYVRANVPVERYSIVYDDYKFDNVILHPSEPQVIAILDWELSTIGHTLLDCGFVTNPYWNTVFKAGDPSAISKDGRNPYAAENRAESGMPDPNELLDWYSQIVGFDPRQDGTGKDRAVAEVSYHVNTITHGIQARTITG